MIVYIFLEADVASQNDVLAKLSLVESKLGVGLRAHQIDALTALAAGKDVILHSPTGCHAAGQGILLADGRIKSVEDVTVGDELMGPDSRPRLVKRLIRGHGELYRIEPIKGDAFIVNKDHVLTLVRTGTVRNVKASSRKRKDLGGDIVDVSVAEWLAWPAWKKHTHKLFRRGVEFARAEELHLPVDPYFLGAILGDGSMKQGTPSITTADDEMVAVVTDQAEARGLEIFTNQRPDNASTSYYFSSGKRARKCGRRGGSNSLINDLRCLGLWGSDSASKFIPDVYKRASRPNRLELLAGLVDTDGHLHHSGYDYISKSERLANDVAFLARSLGKAAYVKKCQKGCQTGAVGTYFRVSVSGDLSVVPCRIKRKSADRRQQIKDATRTGFTATPCGAGEFFGFTIDGDGRYLLSDFTVTHNSGKTVAFQGAPFVSPHDGITVILYPLRALVKDQTRRFAELGLPSVTLYGETKTVERPAIIDKIISGEAKLLLTTPESFDRNRRLQEALTRRGVAVLAVDEAHAYEEWADGFRPTYRSAGKIAIRVGVKQFLLCSATLTSKGYKTACETLGRNDWTVVQVPPIRSNLIYKDLSEPSSEILARAVSGRGLEAPGICFFTTIKRLEEVAEHVGKLTKKKVLRYHGNMTSKARREAQEAFMSGNEWIFATKAFGMGIDKSNIRNIVHYQLPSSILSYAQETGRAGRDGKEAMCFLTQTERGDAAEFLLDMSVPSPDLVHRVWKELQEIALDAADWFEVDWEEVCKRTGLWQQTVQACVAWLFTGRMMEKRQKRTTWKIQLHAGSTEMAAKYKHKTPEILEAIRAEAQVDDGPASIEMKKEELADIVGNIIGTWTEKLRKMAEVGIISIEEPPKGRSSYRFLHNEFKFAQGQDQLKQARASAFKRLFAMRDLQNTPAARRREVIEDAISLNMDEIPTVVAPTKASTQEIDDNDPFGEMIPF